MLGGIFVGVLLGYPLAISIGGVGIVIGLVVFGPRIAGRVVLWPLL